MAKTAEEKQKWLDAIIREREQRESEYALSWASSSAGLSWDPGVCMASARLVTSAEGGLCPGKGPRLQDAGH